MPEEMGPAFQKEHDPLHTYEELLAMPQEELAGIAIEQQEAIASLQGLNSSLARLQQRREAEYATEKEEIVMAAELDPLTGLLNKRAWIQRIEDFVMIGEEEFGVIFIDLSKFKLVNDTLGHVAGDEILQKTAAALDASLRHGEDELAHDAGRYGGDEFAILCDLGSRAGSTDSPKLKLEKIIGRIRDNFASMITEEQLDSLGFDAAIGGAIFESGMTAEDLLRQADKAMYSDKYARTEVLSDDEITKLKAVQHILHKAGVRLPDSIA